MESSRIPSSKPVLMANVNRQIAAVAFSSTGFAELEFQVWNWFL